jgi:DNA-binding IclR family transcriptional regulator
MPGENGSTTGIQVIARAADILRAIESHPGGLSQAEIADQLGLARSTAHRILNALEEEHFVAVQQPRGRYRIGPEISRLAKSGDRDLANQIRPFLLDLSREINETVDLSFLDGDRITFIDQIVAPNMLSVVSGVGLSFPLHCTAPGKAILASLPAKKVAALLGSELPSLTPKTITSMPELRAELARVSLSGVAYNHEEHHLGICAVGCIIGEFSGTLLALSVPVPSHRFDGRETILSGALLQCRDRILESVAVPDSQFG